MLRSIECFYKSVVLVLVVIISLLISLHFHLTGLNAYVIFIIKLPTIRLSYTDPISQPEVPMSLRDVI